MQDREVSSATLNLVTPLLFGHVGIPSYNKNMMTHILKYSLMLVRPIVLLTSNDDTVIGKECSFSFLLYRCLICCIALISTG